MNMVTLYSAVWTRALITTDWMHNCASISMFVKWCRGRWSEVQREVVGRCRARLLEVQSELVGGAEGGGWRCRGRLLEVQREVVGGAERGGWRVQSEVVGGAEGGSWNFFWS